MAEVFWESSHQHFLDDPSFPSTSRSVNGVSQSGISCSRSPEAVGARSLDAASASLRGLVSAVTLGTTIGAQFFHLP